MTDNLPSPHSDPESPESGNDEVKMNPWLITAGIIALLIGLFSGLIMSQATLVK